MLKVKRWDAGIKQYELAIKLRCSAPYLSLVENGRVDPPKEFKALAAQILKARIEEIFPETVKVERIFKDELSNRSNRINFDAC